MGTDRYGEKKPGFDHITLRTNPYKSVQKNVQSAFFGSGGSTALTLVCRPGDDACLPPGAEVSRM